MSKQRPPDHIPQAAQIALLIFACSCVALLGANYLVDAHVFASVDEAMNDATLSAATATMAVIALRVLPGR